MDYLKTAFLGVTSCAGKSGQRLAMVEGCCILLLKRYIE